MASTQHIAFLIMVPSSGNASSSSQSSGGYNLSLVTLSDIEAAKRLTRELVSQGVDRIELSSSFGEQGLETVRKVAGEDVEVGLVRFD
ncbi:DUF6506 family protein [Halomonas sp. PR-M31]|uniref:DUF6506 family protein n=1 Tax=Halomonas sp. PR-M31 TaxID=1471202 RepID=UPI00069EB064|nr:DUF6506 family protein [Halomonas sp. PR-M31]